MRSLQEILDSQRTPYEQTLAGRYTPGEMKESLRSQIERKVESSMTRKGPDTVDGGYDASSG